MLLELSTTPADLHPLLFRGNEWPLRSDERSFGVIHNTTCEDLMQAEN